MRAPTLHHPRQTLLIGIALVLVLAAAGFTTGYFSLSRTVTLSVDGRTQQVRTFGDSVGDVLASRGIKPGAHDDVVPAVNTPVNDGTRIAVRIGRPLELSVDVVRFEADVVHAFAAGSEEARNPGVIACRLQQLDLGIADGEQHPAHALVFDDAVVGHFEAEGVTV